MNWKKSGHIILLLLILLTSSVRQLLGCGYTAPDADFSASVTTTVVDESITFRDTSIPNDGTIDSWSWTFGSDANPPSITGQGPHVVSYTSSGTKNVSLIISYYYKKNRTDTELKNGYITVGLPPTAGAIGTAQTICSGATPAALTSTTNGGGSGTITYEWQTNATGVYVTISGATSSGYQPPALTSTTSYRRRTVTVYGGKTRYSLYTNEVTITVVPQPTVPTLNVKTPNLASICAGQGVSATFNSGSGGAGCSDDYTVSIDGGAATVYSPGSTVGTTAISSIVIQGRRSNCTLGTGCTGTSYVTLASWAVNPLPTPTFTDQPNTSECQGNGVIYVTELGMTNYLWTVPGTINSDYSISSGGIDAGSNAVELTWLTTGSKTVTVGYTGVNGCASATPALSTITVNPTPVIGTFN